MKLFLYSSMILTNMLGADLYQKAAPKTYMQQIKQHIADYKKTYIAVCILTVGLICVYLSNDTAYNSSTDSDSGLDPLNPDTQSRWDKAVLKHGVVAQERFSLIDYMFYPVMSTHESIATQTTVRYNAYQISMRKFTSVKHCYLTTTEKDDKPYSSILLAFAVDTYINTNLYKSSNMHQESGIVFYKHDITPLSKGFYLYFDLWQVYQASPENLLQVSASLRYSMKVAIEYFLQNPMNGLSISDDMLIVTKACLEKLSASGARL